MSQHTELKNKYAFILAEQRLECQPLFQPGTTIVQGDTIVTVQPISRPLSELLPEEQLDQEYLYWFSPAMDPPDKRSIPYWID